jgi:hypothetical protein
MLENNLERNWWNASDMTGHLKSDLVTADGPEHLGIANFTIQRTATCKSTFNKYFNLNFPCSGRSLRAFCLASSVNIKDPYGTPNCITVFSSLSPISVACTPEALVYSK